MFRTSNASRVSWLMCLSHVYMCMSQMTAAQHVPDFQHVTRVMAHVNESLPYIHIYIYVTDDCGTACPGLPTHHACHGNGICTTDSQCACRAGHPIYACTVLQCVAVRCSASMCMLLWCSYLFMYAWNISVVSGFCLRVSIRFVS